jgi:hypothetical protein
LRAGPAAQRALFRLGAGTNLPAGITLNSTTGVLAGIIAQGTPIGVYPVVIERYNLLGETVSQSFSLSIVSEPIDYVTWIAGYNVGNQTGMPDDFDGDELSNALENLLGSDPSVANGGLRAVRVTPGSIVFRHSLSNGPATDLTLHYEWSTDLTNWFAPGASNGAGVTVEFQTKVIEDRFGTETDLIEVTASAATGDPAKIFVRLAAHGG